MTAISALLGAATDLSARDRIALPFKCSLDGGRLRVEPAAEHTYPVVGSREQQPFTYCPPNAGKQCRTFMLHKLSIQCDGGRATWPEVVAAAGRDRGRVALDNGQLLLRLGPRRDRTLNCGASEASAPRSPIRWEQCQLASGSGPQRALVLPRGYAPLGIIGARLLINQDIQPVARPTATGPGSSIAGPAAERPQTATAAPTPGNPASAVPTATSVPQALVTPSPQPNSVVAALPAAAPALPSPPPEATKSWMTTPVATETLDPPRAAPTTEIVEIQVKSSPIKVGWLPTTEAEAAPMRAEANYVDHSPGPTGNLFALMLLATAMVGVAAMVARRRGLQPSLAGGTAGGRGDAPRAVALRTKAEGHIQQIETAIDRLAAVAPLQNALTRDMQSSQRRLAMVIAATADRSVDWARARRRLERVAQDLDRLQSIADSAVSSLSGLGSTRSLPRDRNEAYASLGVRPGVSDAILKKLVDALRVSWHPDLAKSPADREAREVRIKEINVAWDLITGKREAD